MACTRRMRTFAVVVLLGAAGMAGCAHGDDNTQGDQQVAEQTDQDKTQDDSQDNPSKGVVEKTGDAIEHGAQEVEEKAKDVGESAGLAAETSEKNIEEFIGGGPVESDTRSDIEEVDRKMAAYHKALIERSDQLGATNQLKWEQLRERSNLVKKQYNQLRRQTDWDVAKIDQQLEDQADSVKDDWDDLEDDLQDTLGKSYEDLDDHD